MSRIHEQIAWEAEQYFEFDVREARLDCRVLLAECAPGEMDVLLVAAKNALVEDLLNVARAARLKPLVVDHATFAVERAFLRSDVSRVDDTVALVHLGADRSLLSLVTGGILSFVAQEDMGSSLFSWEAQRSLATGPQEAQALLETIIGHGGLGLVPHEVAPVIQRVSDRAAVAFGLALRRSREKPPRGINLL